MRHLHASERRFNLDAGGVGRAVGHEGHHHGLEVQQERIRCCVVGAQRFAVEEARVNLDILERTFVQNNVAGNGFDAQALHPTQEQPQPLRHQLRVALALDVEVAEQRAVSHCAFYKHGRGPGEGGAKQVQRSVGGNQLHHRSRVHADMGPVAQARWCAALGIHHQHRHRVFWHFGAGQGGFDLRRECLDTRLGIGLCVGNPVDQAKKQQQGAARNRLKAHGVQVYSGTLPALCACPCGPPGWCGPPIINPCVFSKVFPPEPSEFWLPS